MSTTTANTSHDDDGVIADLPDLRIEVSHSEDMVILEQGAMTGNPSRVAIHKWQVRLLAEEMGLTLAPAPSPRRDVEQILARRLRWLHARNDELLRWLLEHTEDDFARDHAFATATVADEYLADLGELLGADAARAQAQRPATVAPAARTSAADGRSDAPVAPAKTRAPGLLPAPAAGNSGSPSKVGAQGRLAV